MQRCLAGCMQPVLDAEKNTEAEVQQLQVGPGGRVGVVMLSKCTDWCVCCVEPVDALCPAV